MISSVKLKIINKFNIYWGRFFFNFDTWVFFLNLIKGSISIIIIEIYPVVCIFLLQTQTNLS